MLAALQYILLLTALFSLPFGAVPALFNNIPSVALLLLIMISLFRGTFQKARLFQTTGLELPFLAYLGATLFSVVDAYIKLWALGKFISLSLLVLIFYFLFTTVQNRKQYEKVLAVIYLGGIILLISGLYQYSNYLTEYQLEKLLPFFNFIIDDGKSLPRIKSLFIIKSGINVYACYLALFAPLLLQLAARYKNKLLQIITWFLVLTSVLLTYSRALFVALVLSSLVWMWLYKKIRKEHLAGFLLLLSLSILFIPSLHKTATSLFDRRDSSNWEHLQTFQSGLQQIFNHPLNGWGADHVGRRIKQVGNSWVDAHDYQMGYTAQEWYPAKFYEMKEKAKKAGVIQIDSPHNMYLWVFIELGIIGFAAFVWLLTVIFQKLLAMARSKSPEDAQLGQSMLFGYITFLIYGLFQDSLYAPMMTAYFWIFLLLVIWLGKFKATSRTKH